ncbi:MAG TPA: hypothetical protein VMT53_08350 [Terriglobales bacterium]|nr:hypothetical protein [Terriglobales bacterium]
MNANLSPEELAAEWRNWLVLYRAYTGIAREFSIESQACPESAGEQPTDAGVQQARHWFDAMDQQIHVYQLRQFLQTSASVDDEILRLLLVRHLEKQPHSSADRDKVDFLLVQYFSHLAPVRLEDVECDLAYVAQALENVVGAVNFSIPDWLAPLEQVIESATACSSLNELFRGRVLEEGRKLKANSGEDYFTPIALVAFARFNFLIRRIFFRLMHDEINCIHDGLHELERRGTRVLDCRRAHFSRNEPVERLRMICHSWKVMFHAEYSSGQPLKILTDLRMVVQEALSRSERGPLGNKPASGQPTQVNAAKPASAAGMATNAPEFEIAATLLQHQEE